jgi:glycosyltransferase involved in cell wall biosynthesis
MLQMKLWRHWRHVFRRVVANSRSTARRLEEDGIGPVEVVWNGVPSSPARAFPSGPPLIAFAGRLIPEKGADVLIRAFAAVRRRFPQARLLIAGDGPERTRLVHLIEEQSLASSVTMTGHLTRAQMEESFAGASVQVAPSRWEEPFGLVAAEALMRGTPLVATNAGGLRELVQHESTGLLVPPHDETALAAAILRLIEDHSLARELSVRGREFALRHLTEAAFVDHFLVLYEEVLRSEK